MEPEDNVIALSRYRARLGRGRKLRRADALMSLPNPEQAIRALPGDELYYLLREDDPREAKDILAYAKAEQIQVVLDFGLWSGDQLAPERMEEWVDVLSEMPYETIGRWIRGLDIELVALLIRKGARIYDLDIEDPPDEPVGSFYPTPDRFFVLDVVGYAARPKGDGYGDRYDEVVDRGDGDGGETSLSARALMRIVDALYRADKDLARRILVGAKAELDSELEEMALRWRRGRMADLGFIDAVEALEIYRELDPASVRIGEARAGTRVRPVDLDDDTVPPDLLRGPGVLGEHLGGTSLFARALGRVVDGPEIEELHFALVALANRVLAADRIDPADDQAVAAGITRMRATLDLAVEFLARGRAGIDEDRALEAVRTVPVMRLFRLGISLVGKVRALAQALRRRGPFAGVPHLDLVEEPEATVLPAVDRARPAFSSILDDPPGMTDRPFGSLADIARATAAIRRAAVAQAMLLTLGVRPEHLTPGALEGVTPSDPAEIDAGVLVRTALALLMSTDDKPSTARGPGASAPPSFRPLTPDELDGFRSSDGPRRMRGPVPPAAFSDVLRARARRILEKVAPAGMEADAREMIERWLETLSPLGTVLVGPGAATRRPKPKPPTRTPPIKPAVKTKAATVTARTTATTTKATAKATTRTSTKTSSKTSSRPATRPR